MRLSYKKETVMDSWKALGVKADFRAQSFISYLFHTFPLFFQNGYLLTSLKVRSNKKSVIC